MLRIIWNFRIYSWWVFLTCALAANSMSALAQEPVNPHQNTINDLNHKKALRTAQKDLEKVESELAKDQFSPFPDGFGKDGTLTIETADRDKFHVTARTADSYRSAAKELAAIVKDDKFIVMLTDLDRNAIAIYRAEKIKLDRLLNEMSRLLPQKATQESAELLGVGALLTQVAQFSQVFRTNKSLSFTDALIPEELMLDLIAVESSDKLLYPSAALDAVYSGTLPSTYANGLSALISRRIELANIDGKKEPKAKEQATALLSELDLLGNALVTTDATTKLSPLMTILRGELSDEYIKTAEGRIFTVRIIAKGGASLKTSSIWRSDRLYASGGVVATYRLTGDDKNPRIVKAGVVISETKFINVPLND